MSFKDHFSGHADDYARFRPVYPDALFQWLAEQVPATARVWDCGCGNGQASRQLARFFPHVDATDASKEQIAQASGPANIEFHTALAEDCGLAPASVDLICVAQALHWFDEQAFYTEAQRVARPGGVLAVWCYGSPRLAGPPGEIVSGFELETVGPHWPAERAWIDQGYASVGLPGEPLAEKLFTMEASWPLDLLVGYVGSWSATHRYFAATGHNPLPGLRAALAKKWGNPETERLIRWPLHLRASRLGTGAIS